MVLYLCLINTTHTNIKIMGAITKEVSEKPTRVRRVKKPKSRLHIYIIDETIDRIDNKATEMGLNRSNCLQVLINFGLDNLKMKHI